VEQLARLIEVKPDAKHGGRPLSSFSRRIGGSLSLTTKPTIATRSPFSSEPFRTATESLLHPTEVQQLQPRLRPDSLMAKVEVQHLVAGGTSSTFWAMSRVSQMQPHLNAQMLRGNHSRRHFQTNAAKAEAKAGFAVSFTLGKEGLQRMRLRCSSSNQTLAHGTIYSNAHVTMSLHGWMRPREWTW